jgi:hypothetical protein
VLQEAARQLLQALRKTTTQLLLPATHERIPLGMLMGWLLMLGLGCRAGCHMHAAVPASTAATAARVGMQATPGVDGRPEPPWLQHGCQARSCCSCCGVFSTFGRPAAPAAALLSAWALVEQATDCSHNNQQLARGAPPQHLWFKQLSQCSCGLSGCCLAGAADPAGLFYIPLIQSLLAQRNVHNGLSCCCGQSRQHVAT